MKRFLSIFLLLFLLLSAFPVSADAAEFSGSLEAASAILIEPESGTVRYEKNADERRFPASVTKVMTLLLVFEAIDSGRLSLDDNITVSPNAAGMGGSQVFLAPGEVMRAEDLLKSVIIASANDAAVALAEHLAGSEESFVATMNRRAAELGMTNTHFENATGLDDTATDHKTSARDLAVASRELILSHPKILEYTGIWMDSIRDGAFTLTNTNRLIRFYNGATGLKTGSTAKAGFCISATAERNGTKLIAVIMGCSTRDRRNAEAKMLLDFGFANYEVFRSEGGSIEHIAITGGVSSEFRAVYPGISILLEKGSAARVKREISLSDSYAAPVETDGVIGMVSFTLDGKTIGESPIRAAEKVEKIGFAELFRRVAQKICAFS